MKTTNSSGAIARRFLVALIFSVSRLRHYRLGCNSLTLDRFMNLLGALSKGRGDVIMNLCLSLSMGRTIVPTPKRERRAKRRDRRENEKSMKLPRNSSIIFLLRQLHSRSFCLLGRLTFSFSIISCVTLMPAVDKRNDWLAWTQEPKRKSYLSSQGA